MNQPPDPLEFLKTLWGPMGLPMAGLTAPVAGSSELDKRLAELKSVENWLNMNLNVLRMTIQGLEMQKAALAAIQSAAGGDKEGAPARPAAAESPSKK